MAKENLIHIKLEYEEAIDSKKDILSSEANLLRIIRALKQYQGLRMNELKLKTGLYQKAREFRISIGQLQQTLPKLKIPSILKKHEEIKDEKPMIKKSKEDGDLEVQLREIQERLRQIGQTNNF